MYVFCRVRGRVIWWSISEFLYYEPVITIIIIIFSTFEVILKFEWNFEKKISKKN